jgi:hypothetical protein
LFCLLMRCVMRCSVDVSKGANKFKMTANNNYLIKLLTARFHFSLVKHAAVAGTRHPPGASHTIVPGGHRRVRLGRGLAQGDPFHLLAAHALPHLCGAPRGQ